MTGSWSTDSFNGMLLWVSIGDIRVASPNSNARKYLWKPLINLNPPRSSLQLAAGTSARVSPEVGQHLALGLLALEAPDHRGFWAPDQARSTLWCLLPGVYRILRW